MIAGASWSTWPVAAAYAGTSLSDLKVLLDQPVLFGPVASDPTAWRVLDSIDTAVLAAINEARAKARAAAWEASARPPVDFIVLDFDTTLVTSHSDKADAASNYKHGFGFHPPLCFVDVTNDAVAGVLRPGNAGSNTEADHIAPLDVAPAQLPVKTVRSTPRARSGCWPEPTRPAPPTTSSRRCGTGDSSSPSASPMDEAVRQAALGLPKKAWQEAIRQDRDVREGAEVAEITGRLDLSGWPDGTRAIVRHEGPRPGPQLTFSDIDGRRFQVFICDSTDDDLAYLEGRHRGHARVENRISNANQTGLMNFPCHDIANNQAWCSWHATSSPGPCSSSGKASWRGPNPNACATACCIPPGASPVAGAELASGSKPTGHGATS
jgi:hypothetical protein